MKKYGFIYIWFDRKHKRYYIGSHWGTEDDGYICSSRWMRKAYKRRPKDFKRRIISKVYSNRKDLLEKEFQWLYLIKDCQLKSRYYNINKYRNGHWSTDENKTLTVGKKISKANKGKPAHNKGKTLSDETKQKISDRTKLAMSIMDKSYLLNEEYRKKLSDNSKRLQKEKKIGMHGKKHSEKTLKLMSINNAMNDPKYRDKIGEANRGTKGLWLNGIKKMAKPETEKWNLLISEGYLPAENL